MIYHSWFKFSFCSLAFFLSYLPGYAQSAYISSDKPGTVWTRPSDNPTAQYSNTNKVTPTAIPMGLQDRIDVRVLASKNLLQEQVAEKTQIMSGMKVSLTLHNRWRLDRLAGLGFTLLLFISGGYWNRIKQKENTLAHMTQSLHQAEANSRLPKYIGNYKILEELGHGGMAQVLKAQDQSSQLWAIKRSLVNDDGGRLEREYDILSQLNHPNIVAADHFAPGTKQAPPYLVIQYLDHPLLRQLITNSSPIPLSQAKSIGTSLLQTLSYAHAQGCYHRDLKPENIFIRPDNSCVIIDFGIAKSLEAEPLTKTWELLGTPLYAPPEQVNSKHVGPSADIYSVGTILLEATTGKLPWNTTDPIQLFMAKQQSLDSSPQNHFDQLPQAWTNWFIQATNPDPKKRFATPRLALQALQELES